MVPLLGAEKGAIVIELGSIAAAQIELTQSLRNFLPRH
jgi:hypothetical protein